MASRMILETVRSDGLAHLSYLVGHKGRAAVIDPRRDIDVYLRLARRHGCRITHVFETHRNEDYVIGSQEVARRTRATVLHGEGLDWGYGETVSEGDEFAFGDLRLRVLATPGHTFDSISLAMIDTSTGDDPVAVFTGDALFVGDVGRTDFFPDRAEEVAGLLYDSIFETLLPLGDHVLVYPAHGAGSVCGHNMAPRDVSTLGYERRFNPALQVPDRDAFIANKTSEHHYKPPYFKQMELYNQEGSAPPMPVLPDVPRLEAEAFADAADAGAFVLDVRGPEAFAGAFVPGSLNVPADMIGAYAGWFVPYDRDVLLVVEDEEDLEPAVRSLVRIGIDRIAGYLGGGLQAWETAGKTFADLPVMTARKLAEAGTGAEGPLVLDVRKDAEYKEGHVVGAQHIFLGHLPDRLDEVPGDRPVVTFCGSGQRASIAASILSRNGFTDVANNLGSMAACRAVGCPIEE